MSERDDYTSLCDAAFIIPLCSSKLLPVFHCRFTGVSFETCINLLTCGKGKQMECNGNREGLCGTKKFMLVRGTRWAKFYAARKWRQSCPFSYLANSTIRKGEQGGREGEICAGGAGKWRDAIRTLFLSSFLKIHLHKLTQVQHCLSVEILSRFCED
jgi:hypothetical protein